MMTEASNHPGTRHFGLDWLRIAAFLLLIFFHIGKYFGPDEWLVKTPHPVAFVEWPMLAIQPWRMPLLFVVSGYASCALLGRCGGVVEFLHSRSRRLLLPLGFGMLLLVPPQTWIGLVGNHGYQASLLHFWTVDWPSFGVVSGVAMPNAEHLWFLAYLWTYTMALGLTLATAPAGWARRVRPLAERLAASPHLLMLPLAFMLFLRIVLLFTVPESHGLLHDWISDFVDLPAFLFGFILAAVPSLWPSILRARRPAALVAAAALLLLIVIQLRYPGHRPHLAQALHRDAEFLMAWSMILLLLGVAHQWLNRDHPLRARLSEAVFPAYLAHQTIIVIVGWAIRDRGLGNSSMFLLLVAATFIGCWVFYAIGSRIAWLRPLVGLVPARSARGPQPAAATARI